MGVDLRLVLPYPGVHDWPGQDDNRDGMYARNVLWLTRERRFWDPIKAVAQPLPAGYILFDWDDTGVVEWTTDHYGIPLTTATADALINILSRTSAPTTRAAVAYLKAIDPDTPIILDWR